jgi:hypothetical protein
MLMMKSTSNCFVHSPTLFSIRPCYFMQFFLQLFLPNFLYNCKIQNAYKMEKQTYQVNILQIVIPPCSSRKNLLANPFSCRQCSLFVWHHICSSFQHDPQCSRCLFCCLAALMLSKISMLLRTFVFLNI